MDGRKTEASGEDIFGPSAVPPSVLPAAGWADLADLLQAARGDQSVYVVGPPDTGKTTFCRFLAARLSQGEAAACVDCDPGQAWIGPPSTVGLGLYRPQGPTTAALRFVGSTSPAGHLLQTLTGIRRLADKAAGAGARRIVFDSCGLCLGALGEEFQFQTVDLLQPNHLVAIQKGDELEGLLRTFVRRPGLRIHRLAPSPAVSARTAEQRLAYRTRRLREHFADAVSQEVSLGAVGLHGRVPDFGDPAACRGRLIALCDETAFVLAVGIAETLDPAEGRLRFLAPSVALERVGTVQFGSLRCLPTGAHDDPLCGVRVSP